VSGTTAPRPVLVTGARAPVALDMARAWRAAGHPVTLGDSVAAVAARWSRGGRGAVVRLPSPRHAFDGFARTLHDWVDAHPDALVVPTCEEVFHVAAAAERHGLADQVFAPSTSLLRRLHSKVDFPAWAATIGLDAPGTTVVVDAGALDGRSLADRVLKPEFSRFGTATMVGPSPRDAARIDASPTRRWALQERVVGEEVMVWAAARDGRVVASVAYRPTWRLGRSAAFAFEAVDVPAAEAVAAAVADASGLTGQISFDIIMTPDGRAVPIECNPRTVSGLHLAAPDGALARALVGDGPAVRVTTGVVHLAPAMVLLGLPEAVRSGRLRSWSDSWRAGTDAVGRDGDRGAVLGSVVDVTGFAVAGALQGRGTVRQSTHDIEWNGEPW
jgi:hypothetical protein